MQTETTISKNIRIADKNAQYDAACKRLLSEKMILAWIMKSCLPEYRDLEIDDIAANYIEGEPQIDKVPVAPDETNAAPLIHGNANEDTTMTEGTITYDIRFFAKAPVSGELIRLIVNVEAQGDFYPGYPLIKRAIYYDCRMISAQYGTEFTDSHYEKIKKVYSIFICMNPPKYRENSINSYSITEKIIVGDVREEPSHYDLLSAVMICLSSDPDKQVSGVLRLLNVLLSAETPPEKKKQILQNDFKIPMTQNVEKEVSNMAGLGAVLEEKGRAKGRAEGRAEGTVNSIKIIKLYAKGMSNEEIASSLQLDLEYVEDTIAKYEND